MKIRTDFVTNSSSSSFVFFGFYSPELLSYLQELIDRGFTYRHNGKETMATDGWITSYTGYKKTAVVDALTYIPYGKNSINKIGFNIELQVSEANESEENEIDEYTDPAAAFLAFLDPNTMTPEQEREICAKVEKLVTDAQEKGQILQTCREYATDAGDFAKHFSAGDYDKATFVSDKTGAIIKCKNKNIKEAHIYSAQNEINPNVFQNMTSLQLVFFHSNSPSTISKNTFAGCTSLKAVKGLTCFFVEEKAFSSCISLKKLDFLGAFVKIGSRAFENCTNLEQITFFGDATLSADVFSGCKELKRVVFYGRKDILTANLFVDCPEVTIVGYEGSPVHKYAQTYNLTFENLDELSLDESFDDDTNINAAWFGWINEDIIRKGFILNDRKMIVGYIAPEESFGRDTTQITVPERTRVASGAFRHCTSIKTINAIISNWLSYGAFAYCSSVEKLCLKKDDWTEVLPRQLCEGAKALHTVELPEGIYRINARAFYGCENLKSINIPDSVMYIDPTAFEGCDSLPQETKDKIVALSNKATFDEKIAAAVQYLQTNGYSAFCFDQRSYGQLFRDKAELELWHALVDPYLDYPDILPKGKATYVVHAGGDVQIDMSMYGWKQQKTLSNKVNYLIIDTENIEGFFRYPRKHLATERGHGWIAKQIGKVIEETAIELKKAGGSIQIITKAHLETLL